MGLSLTSLLAVHTPEDPDAIRLAQVEAEFTPARLAFNDAYQRFVLVAKTHQPGPYFMRSDDRTFVEFPRESAEAKEAAAALREKGEQFHALMRERADLLLKLRRIK